MQKAEAIVALAAQWIAARFIRSYVSMYYYSMLYHIFYFSHCIFSHFLPYMLSSFLISIFECRKILHSNEYSLEKIGFDTAENGSLKVCQKVVVRQLD